MSVSGVSLFKQMAAMHPVSQFFPVNMFFPADQPLVYNEICMGCNPTGMGTPVSSPTTLSPLELDTELTFIQKHC